MNCSICKTETPQLTLKAVWVGERQLWVCDDCIAEAIIDHVEKIEKIEQIEREWCHGCAQFVGNTCQAGLTPDRCC